MLTKQSAKAQSKNTKQRHEAKTQKQKRKSKTQSKKRKQNIQSRTEQATKYTKQTAEVQGRKNKQQKRKAEAQNKNTQQEHKPKAHSKKQKDKAVKIACNTNGAGGLAGGQASTMAFKEGKKRMNFLWPTLRSCYILKQLQTVTAVSIQNYFY